jgi:aminopeptidase N
LGIVLRLFIQGVGLIITVAGTTLGETTINSYLLAGQGDDRTELTLQYARDALKSFSARFGAYPYTEFDVVGAPMMALGMEYPGVVAIALSLYEPDTPLVSLESTVAHEVGHQWFYNVVGNDQVDEPWVDEALVQYITGLYYRDTYGVRAEQDWHDWMYGRWNRVEQADIPIGMPAGSYDGAEYGAIVYGRGPLFIAALAEEMGQETFDEFLRDYYESHQWGIGAADEFKQLAEQHCQCDLTALFEEWVYPK